MAIEACNAAGIFGCLLLTAVEVGGHGHDAVLHFLATKVSLRQLFHLFEYDGRDLLWVEVRCTSCSAMLVELHAAAAEVVLYYSEGP